MGTCRFCGENAGFFRSSHDECERARDAAVGQISNLFEDALTNLRSAEDYVRPVREIAAYGRLTHEDTRLQVLRALTKCAYQALDDHLLTEPEEARLSDLHRALDIPIGELEHECYNKLAKAAMLRELSEGKVPERVQIEGSLPVILSAKERLIFAFTNVDYLEPKTKTHYVGRSSGVSVRVARGLYFRTGASQGERIQTTEITHVDTGMFVITNMNLYFKGAHKAFKVAYKKLLSVQQYADAIEIFKESANPKAQILKVDDPWFAANLISKASGLSI